MLENCLLMDNVTVGKNVRLRGVIVDAGTTIEDEVVVEGRGAGRTDTRDCIRQRPCERHSSAGVKMRQSIGAR